MIGPPIQYEPPNTNRITYFESFDKKKSFSLLKRKCLNDID